MVEWLTCPLPESPGFGTVVLLGNKLFIVSKTHVKRIKTNQNKKSNKTPRGFSFNWHVIQKKPLLPTWPDSVAKAGPHSTTLCDSQFHLSHLKIPIGWGREAGSLPNGRVMCFLRREADLPQVRKPQGFPRNSLLDVPPELCSSACQWIETPLCSSICIIFCFPLALSPHS